MATSKKTATTKRAKAEPKATKCRCGCNEVCANGSAFRPGHDHRALLACVKKNYGTVEEFLRAHIRRARKPVAT